MLLLQLGINSTRDVWKFCQTSLVLLIPNCTRQRMITYTNMTSAIATSLAQYAYDWLMITVGI